MVHRSTSQRLRGSEKEFVQVEIAAELARIHEAKQYAVRKDGAEKAIARRKGCVHGYSTGDLVLPSRSAADIDRFGNAEHTSKVAEPTESALMSPEGYLEVGLLVLKSKVEVHCSAIY